jgi:hypothetical protein
VRRIVLARLRRRALHRPALHRQESLRQAVHLQASLRQERGSALPLVPVLLLVCVFLGVLAVDTASIFLAQRELVAATAGSANDAASGIRDLDFFSGGEYGLAQQRSRAFAEQSMSVRSGSADNKPGNSDDTFTDHRIAEVTILADTRQVRVTVEAKYRPLFRGILPKSWQSVTLRATSTANAKSAG